MEKIERVIQIGPEEIYQRITEENWKRLTVHMMKGCAVVDNIVFLK